ncbi:hypothetical protein A9Q84_01185 [Halobacteriovorax marinus]|uniref:Ketosynthase family 3 (KS3) domain-containing protein n=1 Tax=Halobacteriovorax marinus TaxID=97084 RepID=A0A1Y5FFY7_9BACT|nr:hypothetical protein A9Q84_01185 [Halobacteriovorax marinus]
MNPVDTISITGHGLISPAGIGLDALWEKCLSNNSVIKNGLGVIPKSDFSKVTQFVENSKWCKSIPKVKSKALYYSLFSIMSAIDSAKWIELNKTDTIVIGTTTGNLTSWEDSLMSYSLGDDKDQTIESIREQSLGQLSVEIKKTLAFTGKVLITSSACSASTQAITLAYQQLSSKRSVRAIVGGVEELGKLTIRGFGSLKLLTEDNCKPFDQNRTGINLSEGGAFFTLERNSDSPYLLRDGSTVLDSYHMTSPHPEGKGYQKSIHETLELSGLTKESISLIHAHGTGSFHNDQSEGFALNAIFGNQVPVISTKGVHGHALAASGAFELGIILKVLETQLIPPSSALVEQDQEIDLLLPRKPLEGKVTNILKATLGFGGVNSSFIVSRRDDA